MKKKIFLKKTACLIYSIAYSQKREEKDQQQGQRKPVRNHALNR